VKKRTIVFDLDFTLYDMFQYLKPAFSGVASQVANKNDLEMKSVHQCLLSVAKKNGYLHENLFNIFLEQLDLDVKSNLRVCIEAFHTHPPQKLQLYPGVESMLDHLRGMHNLMILTDGRASTQQNKVRMLGLDSIISDIVYSDLIGVSKPKVFERWSDYTSFDLANSIMVGDHPIKDIYGSKRVGMLASFRVMTGSHRNLPDVRNFEPDYHLGEVTELINYL